MGRNKVTAITGPLQNIRAYPAALRPDPESSSQIRVVTLEENPWFVAADVCKALGLGLHNGSVSHHLAKLEASERVSAPSMLGMEVRAKTSLISESSLYKLILRSDKKVAKPFQDWVTKVVLPAIRKDGAYIVGEEKLASGEMSEDEFLLHVVARSQTRYLLLLKRQLSHQFFNDSPHLVFLEMFQPQIQFFIAQWASI